MDATTERKPKRGIFRSQYQAATGPLSSFPLISSNTAPAGKSGYWIYKKQTASDLYTFYYYNTGSGPFGDYAFGDNIDGVKWVANSAPADFQDSAVRKPWGKIIPLDLPLPPNVEWMAIPLRKPKKKPEFSANLKNCVPNTEYLLREGVFSFEQGRTHTVVKMTVVYVLENDGIEEFLVHGKKRQASKKDA